MKILTLFLAALSFLALAACESSPIQKPAAKADGTQLGKTGVYASGYFEAGGSVSNR